MRTTIIRTGQPSLFSGIVVASGIAVSAFALDVADVAGGLGPALRLVRAKGG